MEYKCGSVYGNYDTLVAILNRSEEPGADEDEHPDISSKWKGWELVSAQMQGAWTEFIMKKKE